MKIWWIIDKLKTHILFIILAAHLTLVFSQNGSDELNYTLDSVTISSFKISSAVTTLGTGALMCAWMCWNGCPVLQEVQIL